MWLLILRLSQSDKHLASICFAYRISAHVSVCLIINLSKRTLPYCGFLSQFYIQIIFIYRLIWRILVYINSTDALIRTRGVNYVTPVCAISHIDYFYVGSITSNKLGILEKKFRDKKCVFRLDLQLSSSRYLRIQNGFRIIQNKRNKNQKKVFLKYF